MNEPYGNSVVFWLRQAYLAQRRALDETLSVHHLSAAQLDVLMPLWERDGLEQRELQERAGVSSATLTRLLDGLVDRQLVERRPSADDARVNVLFLTSQGHTLQESLQESAAQFMARALTDFSPAEAMLLRDWLRRFASNLGTSS